MAIGTGLAELPGLAVQVEVASLEVSKLESLETVTLMGAQKRAVDLVVDAMIPEDM